jgi:hypothetical protein
LVEEGGKAVAKAPAKENQYDARRETLVVEEKTVWQTDVPAAERLRIATALHRNPQEAKKLEYVLCSVGLIRRITVTSDDVARLSEKP